MEQRIRDLVTGELTLDYFMERASKGWKLASVEWVRDAEPAVAAAEVPQVLERDAGSAAEVPYGLRIASENSCLEENPVEMAVLLLILEQIVKEKRISDIAYQLNFAGHKTREGAPWSQTAVFNLLPRLIEVGPSMLRSPLWQARRNEANRPN